MIHKKKMLLLSDMNFPYGGASANFLRLFATGLSYNNEEVTVVLQRGRQYGNTKNESRRGTVDDVRYWHCCFSNRPRNYFLKIVDDVFGMFIPLIYIFFQYVSGRLKCVIMYTSNAQFSVFSILLCKLLHVPIYNVVSEWPDNHNAVQNTFINRQKAYYFKLQINYFNSKFSGLIVLSHFLKEKYLNAGLNQNKILIQPNFVEFRSFENIKSITHSGTIRIGYCGTPTQKDGIADLLTAFQIIQSKYSDTELLIIGDSPSNTSLIPELFEKSMRLGIDKKVIFTGLVDSREIPQLLHSCNILVLARPSGLFAEAGFPTKLGEYMACKKPVVITKVGDIPLYLKDGESAMLAEPDNPSSVADKICFLIENPDKANLIGKNGYSWAKEKLEYKKATKGIIDFIEK